MSNVKVKPRSLDEAGHTLRTYSAVGPIIFDAHIKTFEKDLLARFVEIMHLFWQALETDPKGLTAAAGTSPDSLGLVMAHVKDFWEHFEEGADITTVDWEQFFLTFSREIRIFLQRNEAEVLYPILDKAARINTILRS